MNIFIVSGKLKDEPKMKTIQSGQTLANFGLEMKSKSKEGEDKVTTMFFTAWGDQAQKLSGLGTGYPVVLRGQLQNRKKEEPGQAATWHLEAVVFEVEVLV